MPRQEDRIASITVAQTMFEKLQAEAGESARSYIVNRVRQISDASQLLMLKEILQSNFPEIEEHKGNSDQAGKPNAEHSGSLKKQALALLRAANGAVSVGEVANSLYGRDDAQTRKTASSMLHWLKREDLVSQDEDQWSIKDDAEPEGAKGLREGSIGSTVYELIRNASGRVTAEVVRATVEQAHKDVARPAIHAALKRLEASGRIRSHGEGATRSFSMRRT